MASRPINIDGMRASAQRRLPRMVFDFVDGGAEDEVTMRDNRAAFEALKFRPGDLGVAHRSQATTVLGHDLASPVMLAPTGLARLMHREGEVAAARAAAAAGTVIVLSMASCDSIDDVAQAAPGRTWFQLYPCRDRWVSEALIARAAAAGASALCITIDSAVSGRRERDVVNGMTLPPRLRLRNLAETMLHPRWIVDLVRRPELPFGNFEGLGPDVPTGVSQRGQFVMHQTLNPATDWDEIRWVREMWAGPLVIKGVMSVAAAHQAAGAGADAVVVSNHGGRQLDGLPASIDVLGEVVDAVGDEVEVLLDSGVRRGSDVVKALALGARACLVGRPYLYGLAVAGEAGVATVLGLLRDEIDRVQALVGCADIREVDRSLLR